MNKNRRVLIISYYYPPVNAMASLRISKFTKYLYLWGWEPYVVTIDLEKNTLTSRLFDLKLEIPENLIVRASELLTSGFSLRFKNLASRVIVPDKKIGWCPYVIKKAGALINKIKPSIIFATGGPYSSLVSASILSKNSGIPWIADIRDLWEDITDELFFPFSLLNEFLERITLGTASKIITVSEPCANILAKKFGKEKIKIIYNGYDDDDFQKVPDSVYFSNIGKFIISYTGSLYEQRNPEPLFGAIRNIIDNSSDLPIELNFYGPKIDYQDNFFRLVSKFGLEKIAFYRGHITYSQSIEVQKSSDLLLLLLWNEPNRKGILPGKLFEYIGSGRPILAIGPNSDSAGELVRKYNLGFVSNDHNNIREYIISKIKEKKSFGKIILPDSYSNIRHFFTRERQTRVLENIFNEVLNSS